MSEQLSGKQPLSECKQDKGANLGPCKETGDKL